MKHIISIVVAVLFIAIAYFYQFGLPDALSSLISNEAAQTAASEGGRAAGPAGAGGGARRGGRGSTTVTLSDVVFTPYRDDYTSVGTGVAQQSVSVISEASGRITKLHFDGTELVKQGDVLIELASESERINVDIARANLSKAEDSLERYTTLHTRNSGVVADVTIKEAQSTVAVARGNLALAEETLAKKTIRAPISGRLGLSDIELGDFISNGTKIVDINNTETIMVEFELPERAIDILGLGKAVKVSTPSKKGKVYQGQITSFDSVVDTATRTVTVRAEIDNEKGELWPGMTFTTLIEEESEPMASVPALAVAWDRVGTMVWIAEEGKVHSVPVVMRKRTDETVWLEGDLKEGMKVVVDGVQKVREGASVVDANAPAESRSGKGGSTKP